MEVKNISGSQVVKNSFWKFCETLGVQLIQLVVTLVLARLLSPSDYGLMALVLVVVNFVSLFINSGIASYLVFKSNIRKQDFFTCLVVNMSVSLLLVLILFLSAPSVAAFYKRNELIPLIRAMSIIIPFSSISSVYNAYAVKLSLHKSLFFRNIVSVPVSGAIALIMAFSGCGVWSLVVQQIIYNILLAAIIVISINITIDGQWKFDKGVIKPMFIYGGTNLATTFVAFISDNINDLVIGKKIDSINLGYYNRGNTLSGVFANVLNNLASSVFFPAFSSYKDDASDLKEKFRKATNALYYLCFPVLLGLSVCSDAFVNALLTDKWQGSIPIIQITCLYYCAIPILQLSSQAYLALGKLKIRVVGEVIKMVLTLSLLFIVISYGINAVALARVIVGAFMVLFTCIVNKLYMSYSIFEFLSDIMPPFLYSLIMASCIFLLSLIKMPAFVLLIVQVCVGIILYATIIKIFNPQMYSYLMSFRKKLG